MNKNFLVAIVLGVLVIIAVIQAFQLVGLKNKLAGGIVSMGGANVPLQTGPSGGAQLPSNLQNLPSMVGGC